MTFWGPPEFWIFEMSFLKRKNEPKKAILVGDLNIAPFEHDVWSHRQLLNVVSHTPLETDTLLGIIQSGEWADVMREIVPSSEKLYSWWSYRNRNWEVSNRGRRLDHFEIKNERLIREPTSWKINIS